MNSYKNDPRPLQTRFASRCEKCGKKLAKGTDAFYWPSDRKILCEPCGSHDYHLFLATAVDEDVFNSYYRR